MKVLGWAVFAAGVLTTGTAAAQCLWCGFVPPACPIEKLINLSRQPLAKLQQIKVDKEAQDSTEGGEWVIYQRPGGTPAAIMAADYGENGRAQATLSILSSDQFVIAETVIAYNHNAGYQDAEEPLKIVKTGTAYYFYCGDRAYEQVSLTESRDATALETAVEERDKFFKAAELKPYLDKMRK